RAWLTHVDQHNLGYETPSNNFSLNTGARWLRGRFVMALLTWSLASLLAVYLVAVFGLTVFQRRLQYFPDPRLTELAQTGINGGEELRLATADGETLVAWHFPPKDGRPLILYFHGNGGALVDRVPRFRIFTARGYGLL